MGEMLKEAQCDTQPANRHALFASLGIGEGGGGGGGDRASYSYKPSDRKIAAKIA